MANIDLKKVSFLEDRNDYRVVRNRAEFERILKYCRATGSALENLDLTAVPFDEMQTDFSGMKLRNIVFSRFDRLRPKQKVIRGCDFYNSTLERVSLRNATIIQCTFDPIVRHNVVDDEKTNEKKTEEVKCKSRLDSVDFFFSQLLHCRFRHAVMNRVDFRYAELRDCSMGNVQVTYGDFYMTAFAGTTNFYDSQFCLCSITNATFEHACLMLGNIDRLIQEEYLEYSNNFLRENNTNNDWHRINPCDTYARMNESERPGMTDKDRLYSEINTYKEASGIFRNLSGIYSGKGWFYESNLAYEKCITYQQKAAKLKYEHYPSWKLRGTIWKNRFIWAMGYGYKWMNILTISFLVIVAVFILFYFSNLFGLAEAISYSINGFLSAGSITSDRLDGSIKLLCSIFSLFGFILASYLGFIIANKVRNNI